MLTHFEHLHLESEKFVSECDYHICSPACIVGHHVFTRTEEEENKCGPFWIYTRSKEKGRFINNVNNNSGKVCDLSKAIHYCNNEVAKTQLIEVQNEHGKKSQYCNIFIFKEKFWYNVGCKKCIIITRKKKMITGQNIPSTRTTFFQASDLLKKVKWILPLLIAVEFCSVSKKSH